MNRQDLLAFVLLCAIVISLGAGMRRLHSWLEGDWRHLSACEDNYWTCVATFEAKPRRGGRQPVVYIGVARACEEYQAYEGAIRRAHSDCRMSGDVDVSTCREEDISCSLPRRPGA